MTNTMIETHALTRHFTVKKHTVEAVRGLDLHVGRGELVALLGPNGAGKSTTLRMLTTLIPPTSGTARVAGYDVTTDQRAVRQHIGYIGQGNGASHNQRGRDELVSQGRCYGLAGTGAKARADLLVESLDLALGMVHAPELLFLDEPSTGLDPQNRANLQGLITELHASRGTTIVLTTHYLEEADAMAQRVIVVDHGAIIADDTAHRLKTELVGDRIMVSLKDTDQAVQAAERAHRADPSAVVTPDGSTLTIRTSGGPELVPDLLRDLDRVGVPALSVEVVRPTLDDVFLHLTGRSLREDQSTATPTSTPTKEIAA